MLTLLAALLIPAISIGQVQQTDERTKLPSGDQSRAQNVFVEVGGQGLLFTANYDTRFSNKRNGLGGRAGIGYIAIDGDHVTTVPIGLNYLLGTGKHLFEVGLGATVIAAGGDDFSLFDEEASNVLGTMSFTYRLQPVNSGFAFRAGLTPIFGKGFFIPYYAGLSLGYTF
ncbi:hypothetical protein SAMN05661099_0220 [Daejeonella lutea]|uniref:Outer membrane protein beta-barrel domain-containing protein n=2 Tax=Daejeonella lutea TaxID=572036 RepID=A0A1T5A2D8_9SPHI|nr:hypothetical protein SAMN05661099_0220 [Daejeonella lutea]